MTQAKKDKLTRILADLKSLTDGLAQTDAVRVELETAFACTGRARRLLLERSMAESISKPEGTGW
jgi:hypothetical protein